jgi:AraC-like DNA-binding protein
VGTSEITLGPGGFVSFVPGCEHELVAASEDLELFAIGYEPELLQAYQRERGEALSFAGGPAVVDAGELRRIRELCLSVDESRDRLALEPRLLSVAVSLTQKPRELPLAWRAAALLVEDPERSRDELTRMLRSNRGDLSRAIHSHVGTSIPVLRNRVRVLNFIRKCDAGVPMMTAARLAGFGSYSQCHRVFLQLFDVSPRDFLHSSLRADLAERFEPRFEWRS